MRMKWRFRARMQHEESASIFVKISQINTNQIPTLFEQIPHVIFPFPSGFFAVGDLVVKVSGRKALYSASSFCTFVPVRIGPFF